MGSFKDIGALRGARSSLGLTQKELAEKLGVARNTVIAMEAKPETDVIRMISSGLLVSAALPNMLSIIDGEGLKNVRRTLKLRQDEFGELLEVSRGTIGRWESTKPPAWVSFVLPELIVRNNK